MTRPVSLQLYRAMMTALSPLLPIYLGRRAKAGKEDSTRLDERFAHYHDAPHSSNERIWLHGVSVGEVSAALALAKELKTHFRQAHFIITTGTVTAAQMVMNAKGDLPLTHYYAPFDAPHIMSRFFTHHKPDFGVIFESDFWPVMMTSAHEHNVPLFLASTQMSFQSADKWQKRPALAQAVFAPVRACFTHDETQAEIFKNFGVSHREAVGSLKLPRYEPKKTDFAKALSQAAKKRPILLGASTHEGEEAQLLALSDNLTARGCEHLLIIAPRHPDRADKVAEMMPRAKRRSMRQLPDGDDSAYLCDSLGDMPSLYQASDIIWLGASFSGKGGHNPLEAASYGKIVICGPSQFKNQNEYDQLMAQDVCHQISDPSLGASFIISILADKDRQKEIAKTGKAYAKQATKRSSYVARKIADMMKGAKG